MNSPHLGEVQVDLGDRHLTIVFTMRSRAQMKAAFGDKASLAQLLSGEDPEAFAKLLLIGLQKYHHDITLDELLNMSVPLIPVRTAVVTALNWSIFGPDGPPKEKRGEKPENPPKPKVTR